MEQRTTDHGPRTTDPEGPTAARPAEWEDAFALLFGHCPAEVRPQRLANALALIREGELDPAGVLVVRDRATVVGAAVCTVVPGGSGLVWPPRAAEGPGRRDIEDRLTEGAIGWLRQRQARLVQALLSSEEAYLAEPLLRHGFRHVTGLWYLRHDRELPASYLDVPAQLTFQTYADADRDLFQRTLLRSCAGTLDCPEVSGLRTAEEIIVGHQAQGRFDPGLWWLGLAAGRPVGVLLATPLTETPGWEVAYVGVVPEMRRRGFGRELMLKVLLEARAAEVPELILTVDGRNRPAWDLYRALGFEVFDKREVFLLLWTSTNP